jgi:hypothetical protein
VSGSAVERRDSENRGSGGDPAGASPGASGPDRLAAAIAELYATAPEDFTSRRGELATVARIAGDRAAAKAIRALHKPTRAAWVVNQLARADPGAPGQQAELAGALRAAQEAGHGPRLRELSAARGALVDALTAQALATVGVPDPPPSLRLEVSETLTAALADPKVAADFAAGTLTRAVQWSGFGLPPADTESGEETDRAPSPARRPEPDAEKADAASVGPGSAAARFRSPAGASVAPAATGTERAAARRQAGETQRLAREAAEQAARRRDQHEDAEGAVIAATAAAAEAASAEDLLEAQVRDLEQRLTQARADLAAARLRARHAEAAERRARQALDHLSRS